MKANKLVTLGLVATLGTSALVGCGVESKNEPTDIVTSLNGDVEISLWHAMGGTLGESLNQLVDKFNETVGKEKGIYVESLYQGSYTDLKSKAMGAIKSGDAPNIIQGTSNDIQEYLASGTVQPLNDYIYDEEVGISDFDDIYEVYRSEATQYDGETIYSLPFSKSTDLFYYNKTFFEEHDLKVPTTWEELENISKQATDITGRPSFGIDSSANFLITGLKQLGGEYTNSNGEILFNNEQSLEVLEMLKENVDNGNWRLAGEDGYMSAPFISGLSQMFIGSSASSSYLVGADFEWASAPIPQFSEDNKVAIQQGNSLAVLNGNKTSEEVYASYEFIKYLTSFEGNLFWSTNTGYSAIRESVANSEEFNAYIEETNDTTKTSGALQSPYMTYESAFITDNGISSNLVRSEVGAMVEEVLLGGLDPQVALDKYEAKLK